MTVLCLQLLNAFESGDHDGSYHFLGSGVENMRPAGCMGKAEWELKRS